MLISKHPLGNTRIFDLTSKINTRFIRNDFNKITYPYKHLAHYSYEGKKNIRLMPSHGNYPEFKMLRDSSSEEMVHASMLFFIEQHELPKKSNILLEAFHMNPYSFNETDWFVEGEGNTKAILCVQREKTKTSLFHIGSLDNSEIRQWDLFPGEMLMMETQGVRQRYHQIEFMDETGFIDVLTFTSSLQRM